MAKKKTCKRKRILNKDGSINKANVKHNKKCEKNMIKDNPWLNQPGGKEYAELVLGKGHELMKKEIKKTKARRKRIRQNKKKQSKKITKIKKKPKKQQNAGAKPCLTCKNDKKKQKGGALCLPCISPLITGASLLGAGALAAKHHYSSSSSGDGKNISRRENLELVQKQKKNNKIRVNKKKFLISQKNTEVVINTDGDKKTKKFSTIQKASQFYDKKLRECKKKGFQKCMKTHKLSKK